MSNSTTASAPDGDRVDQAMYARALLNVLADVGEEKAELLGTQRAILNILDDANAEARRLHDIHGAMLNILDDSEADTVRLGATERAVVNILDDSEADKVHLERIHRAALNILEDANAEAKHLHDIHGAMLNILDDSEADKVRLGATERAVLNILDDSEIDKTNFREMYRAALNILEDENAEAAHLRDAQGAMLNILDDSELDKSQLQQMHRAALNILDDFDFDKSELRAVQRASLNILEDVDLERTVRKQAEEQVRALNTELEARVLKRTEALTLANQELEAFAYSVAHDLRAPLRAVDGLSELVMEDYQERLDEPGRDALRRVRQAAQRMGSLIDDMLTLAHSTRGPDEVGQVDLSAIAESVVAELRRSEPARDARVSIAQGVTGQGDSRLLRSVLDNLLSNAWKFTAHRQDAAIRFSSQQREHDVVYCVQDNGAGFDMAFAHNLFVPFQRLHRASEFPGNGVGLAIVKRIITRLGGTVWAEGSVNQGASFYFTLPRAATEG
jgi:signal transduction histidine kinase